MNYDIIIAVLIIIISVYFLVKRIINDYKKSQIKRKRFFYYKEEGHLARMYENRVVYGGLTTLIVGCIIYIYCRLSGKLENIFPYMIKYYF